MGARLKKPQSHRSVEEEALALFGEAGSRLSTGARVALVRPVVSVEEWVENPYYSGPLRDSLWPASKKVLIEGCRSKYREIILGGAIGRGKSYLGAAFLFRQLYELSCMQDPASGLGQADGMPLYILFVSTSREKAREIGFDYLKAMVDQSPYFREHFLRDMEYDARLVFPKNVHVIPAAATEQGVLSYNMIGLFMDEVNFMKRVEKSKLARGDDPSYDQAKAIYEQARQRRESRFGTGEGGHGKIILGSSAVCPSDFNERRAMEAEKNQEKDVLVDRQSLWEAKRGTSDPNTGKPWFDYDNWFRVEVGDEKRISKVLRGNFKVAAGGLYEPDGAEPVEAPSSKTAKVIFVPRNLLTTFNRDVETALRNLAGIPLLTASPLITNRQAVFDAERDTEKGFHFLECEHPFAHEVIDISHGHGLIWDRLVERDTDGNESPRVRPTEPRFIGVDLSYTDDQTGFAVVHVAEGKPILRIDTDGIQGYALDLHYYVDFMVAIKRPESGEIPQSRILELIEELGARGFFVAMVGGDQVSRSFLQRVEDAGYDTDPHCSTDKTPDAYLYLKQCFDEGRISVYQHLGFVEQLIKLEYNRNKKKIDHLPRERKDICDALAFAVDMARRHYSEYAAETVAAVTCEVW